MARSFQDPISGERVRVEHRICGAVGLASVLQSISYLRRPVNPNDLRSVADALAFHLEQLSQEFGINPHLTISDD